MRISDIAVREIHDPERELPELAVLKDAEIETHEYRAGYLSGEGVVCLSVAPGDEAGEVLVNVQFEGPIGAWDEGTRQQTNQLAGAWEWIREFMDQHFQGDYRVELDMVPCPKADAKIELPAEVESRLGPHAEGGARWR